ncbi:1-deoxy-D-xylulose-5-phosphate synthase N-terminal domain-containing protein, partial [Pseudomonadota bacterium]
STGCPAEGLSASVGLAMALKLDKVKNNVFCVVGDGELQEGQIWEAVLSASQYKLDNLTVIVDWNQLQREGPVRSVIEVEPLAEKFESFGWKTIPVRNGHDFDELLFALERASETSDDSCTDN